MDKNYRTTTICPLLNKDDLVIFRFMTDKSKIIFNIFMYHYKVFNLFKNIIFKNIHDHVNQNLHQYPVDINKNDNKINDQDKKQKKKPLPNDKISELIYQEYDKYYELYKSYKEIIINNNKIIYLFIKDQLKDTVLDNQNFDIIYEKLINNQINGTIYDDKNKSIVYDQIIFKILKSIYLHNFKKYQECLINNIPFNKLIPNQPGLVGQTTKLSMPISEIFKEQIRNNEIITNKYIVDSYKNVLKESYYVTSDQNIVERICFKYFDHNADYLRSHQKKNTMSKAFDSIKSYYKTIGKIKKPQLPKFKNKEDLFSIVFDESCFRLNNNTITLSLGKYISQNYNEITKKNLIKLNQTFKKNKKGIIKSNENILYVDKQFMKPLTKKIKKKDNYIVDNLYIEKTSKHIIEPFYFNFKIPSLIKNVQLIPIHNGHSFKLNVCYNDNLCPAKADKLLCMEKEQINKNIKKGKIVSGDLGVVNLITFYDPSGKQIIISGNYINNLNYIFNKKLDKIKSELEKTNGKKTSKRYYDILSKRERKINNYFDIVANWLIKQYNDVEIFVFGYNVNWKNKCNMGNNMNRKFYEIPYRRLLDKIKYKVTKNGSIYKEINESHTSKCDALMLEEMGKDKEYNGKRIKRSLFLSKSGKIINADVNGAINIMRKFVGPNFKLTNTNVLNPIKIRTINMLKYAIRCSSNEIRNQNTTHKAYLT